MSVQNIANMMADIERRLRQSVKDARQSRADFRAVADSGVSPLLVSKHHARLVAVLSTAYADIMALHHEMTEDAKSLGIDVPPVGPDADDGEIVVFGGGDR